MIIYMNNPYQTRSENASYFFENIGCRSFSSSNKSLIDAIIARKIIDNFIVLPYIMSEKEILAFLRLRCYANCC